MDKNLLLDLARNAIESNFNSEIKIDKENLCKENPFFKEQRASFVTLIKDGKLRGCIGSLVAHRELFDDLVHNAKAAAFRDPRFPALTKEEFSKTKVEISLLTIPKPLEYFDFKDLEEKLIPNKHGGVILELDGKKKQLFYLKFGSNFQLSMSLWFIYVKKAGLNPNSLPGLPKIQIYEAEKIK